MLNFEMIIAQVCSLFRKYNSKNRISNRNSNLNNNIKDTILNVNLYKNLKKNQFFRRNEVEEQFENLEN